MCPACHQATNFPQWLTDTTTPLTYNIVGSAEDDMYFGSKNLTTPLHDPIFIQVLPNLFSSKLTITLHIFQYARNRQSLLYHIKQAGFRLEVLRAGFLVHPGIRKSHADFHNSRFHHRHHEYHAVKNIF